MDILKELHKTALMMHGGPSGILDEGTLHYLTERVSHCSDPVLMAACLLHGIATMHPFFDANKRTALMAADAVLGLHGLMITASNDEASSFVLSVACGEKTEERVRTWIKKNSGFYRSY